MGEIPRSKNHQEVVHKLILLFPCKIAWLTTKRRMFQVLVIVYLWRLRNSHPK